MKQISIFTAVSKLALVGAVGLLVACGSSSDSGVSTTTVSGYVVAAPVNGAQVNIVDGNGNVVAGPVSTSATGQYTLSVPNASLAQDLIMKSAGGTFTDEATGSAGAASGMVAYAPANSLSVGATVCATPGSTIVADLVMNHNKTMTQAQETFAKAFGYTPDVSIHPEDATAPAAGASDESKLAGFRAAVFSQLAKDLGLSQDDQFAMFTALAKDLSDDVLDGVDASGAVDIGATGSALEADIQSRFATAMINFQANANNNAGLDNAQIGNLPFGRIAFTDIGTYQIEYKQIGMMDAMEGKSTFQIHVTNSSTGVDETGLAPALKAMMHMSAHEHSTPMPPVNVVTEDGNGLYTVTLYYLMPSQMMDGTSMGYWDLEFTVAGEKAHFYPAVMMAMGDTAKVSLKGVNDKVMAMDPDGNPIMVSRPYFIFKDGLADGSGMGLYDFSVFVAARETMMSFPAIVDKEDFNSGALVVDIANTVVTVSANGGVWFPSLTANGVWTIDDLPLNNGVVNEIRIKLTVNSEVKTIDGMAAVVDDNDFQTFFITPGGM